MNAVTIEPLSQRDQRWAATLLGKQDELTIGSHGCLLTCIGMMLRLTPDVVNTRFIAAGLMGYADCGACLNSFDIAGRAAGTEMAALEWVSQPYPYAPFPDSGVSRLFSALQAGRVALIQVDGSPSPGHQMHWVLGVGAFRIGDQPQFIVNDPWQGIQTLLSPTFGYNAGRALVQAVIYNVAPATATATARAIVSAMRASGSNWGVGVKGNRSAPATQLPGRK